MDVYTWNIGHTNVKTKILELISVVKSTPKTPDVLVFGFQEISVVGLTEVTRRLSASFVDYTVISNEKTCTMSSLLQNSFVIATVILVRSTKKSRIALVQPAYKSCPLLTKGFVRTQLRINSQLVNIINTHLPFKNDLREYSRLFSSLLRFAPHTDTNIILGDLNSRSMVVADCYKKNVQYECHATNCALTHMIDRLHAFGLSNTIRLPKYVKRTRLIDERACGFQNNMRSNDVFSRFLKSMIVKDFLNIFLKRANNLTNAKEQFMTVTKNEQLTAELLNLKKQLRDFKESSIDFFPTYKRNPVDGSFLLSKRGKGRLPGYADRVIYTNPVHFLIPSEYTSLAIKGNDHLPVVQRFDLAISKV
jgi:hypothetical protein